MKKGSIGLIILIIVIALLVVGAITYFVISNKKPNNTGTQTNTAAPTREEVVALNTFCKNSCSGFCSGIGETYNGQSSASSMNMSLCFCGCGNLGNVQFDKNTGNKV